MSLVDHLKIHAKGTRVLLQTCALAHRNFLEENKPKGTIIQREMGKTWPKQFLFKVKHVLCSVRHTLTKNVRLRNSSEFSFVSKIILFPFNQRDVKQVELCKLSLETFLLRATQRWIAATADFSFRKNHFARLQLELQGLCFFPWVVWRITEQNISLLHFLSLLPGSCELKLPFLKWLHNSLHRENDQSARTSG